MIRVQEKLFDVAAELNSFREKLIDVGGLASFAGYVREEGGSINALQLEHYPGFTEAYIGELSQLATNRFELIDHLVIHRVGRMMPGEVIVLVAAAAKHRRAALDAVDFLMDHLKTHAPFWKKEFSPQGESWIEPRQEDYTSHRNWNSQEP